MLRILWNVLFLVISAVWFVRVAWGFEHLNRFESSVLVALLVLNMAGNVLKAIEKKLEEEL